MTMTANEIKQVVKEAIHEANGADNPEKLYTVTETAKLLGVAYTTICRWIDNGKLQMTADGKYICRREIDHYLSGAR